MAQCIAKLALTGGTSHVSSVVKGLLVQLQVRCSLRCFGLLVQMLADKLRDVFHVADGQQQVDAAGRGQGAETICHRGGMPRCEGIMTILSGHEQDRTPPSI